MGNRVMASKGLCLIPVLAALSLWAGGTQAAPESGFGVYLGAVSSKDPMINATGHGGVIAVDAQMGVDEHWSLSPYIDLSLENTDQPYHISNVEGGLQLRYWSGQWFVGGQYLFHDLLVHRTVFQNGTVNGSYAGPALGVAVGWESQSRWSFVVDADFLEGAGLKWFDGGSNRSSVRFMVGYHWF